MLAVEMEALFVGASEVYHKLRGRAKLGTTAASTVPLTLTGKKPKRSDVLGRWAKFPEKDRRLLEIMPQPEYQHQLENPALPQYLQHEITRSLYSGQGSQTDPVQILEIGEEVPQRSVSVPVRIPLPPAVSSADVSSSDGPSVSTVPPVLPRPTSTDKPGSTPNPPLGPSQVQSSQPVNRQKRKAVKQSIIEEEQIDDEDRDPEFDPIKEQEESEEEEQEIQDSAEAASSASGGVTLSQAESIAKGIPQLPKRRKVVPEENLKYPCKICPQKFQRTSELRDHSYVEHLGQT